MLREVRQSLHAPGTARQAHALLVPQLSKLLQRPHRNPHGTLQRLAPQVGDRHLPLRHEPQERVQHETPPRYRRLTVGRMVHVAPHPPSVVGTADAVHGTR